MITGAASGYQTLKLFDTQNKEVCVLAPNDALLGASPIEDGYRIHVRLFALKSLTTFATAHIMYPMPFFLLASSCLSVSQSLPVVSLSLSLSLCLSLSVSLVFPVR